MDAVLPRLSAGIDRRKIVRTVLAGVTSAALADAVFPMTLERPWDSPKLITRAVEHTIMVLAAGYYATDPRKTGLALQAAERSLYGVFAAKMDAARLREVKATFARLLTMSATVATATGDQQRAIQTGDLAASLAYEVGDRQTAGHAWSVVAAALGNTGKKRAALSIAQRARSHSGRSPAAVMALLEQACAAATLGQASAVLELVATAEAEHAQLPADSWGAPGYPFGTYHPANVKAFAGWALTTVGMYSEATPRLDEAADILSGTGSGLLSFVWLTQAGAVLGSGDPDGAHGFAAKAVARAEARPSWSVAAAVAKLHKRSGGGFTDLVDQTSGWACPPSAPPPGNA
jgi:hypothetical protein